MAEPARRNADGEEPPARKPDPRASGWAAAQQAMITAAQSNALAVRELAARPGDAAALEMVKLTITVLENLGDAFRRLSFDEAVMAEERAAGYRDGYEACRAKRCRLEVIPGGHLAARAGLLELVQEGLQARPGQDPLVRSAEGDVRPPHPVDRLGDVHLGVGEAVHGHADRGQVTQEVGHRDAPLPRRRAGAGAGRYRCG